MPAARGLLHGRLFSAPDQRAATPYRLPHQILIALIVKPEALIIEAIFSPVFIALHSALVALFNSARTLLALALSLFALPHIIIALLLALAFLFLQTAFILLLILLLAVDLHFNLPLDFGVALFRICCLRKKNKQ